MAFKMSKITKYIPKYAYYTIYDIPFKKLYEEGKRSIFIDIDNTIISYDIEYPPKEVINLFEKIKQIGFEIIIVSNNNQERVEKVANCLDVPYFYNTLKPLKSGFKKALKISKYEKYQIITIGDQLMTDVLGSNRIGLDSILVHCIKRSSEKWYTKINRIREKKILNQIKNEYYEDYIKIIEVRGND